jgi:hypothetical protein
MVAIGLLVTLLGFVLSVLSLGMDGTGTRMAVVLVGIAVSLFGIMGLLNRHYLKNALWRR